MEHITMEFRNAEILCLKTQTKLFFFFFFNQEQASCIFDEENSH